MNGFMLDALDRRLIGLLKDDARASVTTLAGHLGVARATVQTRLARLVDDGVINRFTIELTQPAGDTAIRAVTMIEIDGSIKRSVIAQLRRLPAVRESYSTNGKWDLVAIVEAAGLSEFDQALNQIRQIKGIRNSETSILLSRL